MVDRVKKVMLDNVINHEKNSLDSFLFLRCFILCHILICSYTYIYIHTHPLTYINTYIHFFFKDIKNCK